MAIYICGFCKREFKNFPSQNRIYCSNKCYSETLKGVHKVNSGSFPKGLSPWNKGKTGYKIDRKIFNPKFGRNNTSWKGNDVSYSGLHKWVAKYREKKVVCEKCGSDKNLQWANKSGKYKRELDDWLVLCAKCHAVFDNRGEKISQTRKLKKYA